MNDKQFKKLIDTLEPISMYCIIKVNQQCDKDEKAEKVKSKK